MPTYGKESYFPDFMGRPEMAPQIVPSKFADCFNLEQVIEKIRGPESNSDKQNHESHLDSGKVP
jgi:hypothetical protein